jgi:hypothetical protein
MLDEAGFTEHLLDRRSENSKAGCELKYAVIEVCLLSAICYLLSAFCCLLSAICCLFTPA